MKLRRGVCVLISACLFLACLRLPAASQAEQLYKQAQKAEKKKQIVKAYLLYSEAAAADPTNTSYWAKAQALRPAASLVNASPPKMAGELSNEQIDRTLLGTITDADIQAARKPLAPPKLAVAAGQRNYDFRGDSHQLWQDMAAALHLDVLFDTAYRPTHAFHFELDDSDYRTALRGLQDATDSFVVPVNPHLIFVANDTQQKRIEFEPTAAAVVPFPEALDAKEIQEIATGVRGALDSRRLTVDPVRHLILIRDQVTKVRLAERLLHDLLHPRAQVIIDVDLLTTDKSSTLNYGISWPTSFPIVSFLTRSNIINNIPSGFSTFLSFGNGASLLGLGVTSAELFANVSKSTSKSLYHSQIVAADGQPASFHVGEKYPIMTSGYFGNTGSAGTVYTPPPTVNFEDLGLQIKVTPHVGGNGNVSLDLNAQFQLLGATSSDGIPVIANTQYQSKVDLAAGQWAVLAGLMSAQEAKTVTGFPILSYIPLLRNNTITKDKGETLIVLKPHITIAPPPESASTAIWAGTETRFLTDL